MKTLHRYGLAAWLVLVVGISIGAYAGVLPTSIPLWPGADKVGHFFLIGGIAFFLDGALDRRRLGPLPLAPLVVLAVAGIEEYCQRFSPRRTSSWGDFAADVAGVIALTYASRRLAAAAGESAHPDAA